MCVYVYVYMACECSLINLHTKPVMVQMHTAPLQMKTAGGANRKRRRKQNQPTGLY